MRDNGKILPLSSEEFLSAIIDIFLGRIGKYVNKCKFFTSILLWVNILQINALHRDLHAYSPENKSLLLNFLLCKDNPAVAIPLVQRFAHIIGGARNELWRELTLIRNMHQRLDIHAFHCKGLAIDK